MRITANSHDMSLCHESKGPSVTDKPRNYTQGTLLNTIKVAKLSTQKLGITQDDCNLNFPPLFMFIILKSLIV